MSTTRAERLQEILDFVANAPENLDIIAMDCNDHCEQMASLAERVARGASLEDIRPELQAHMHYWHDCREEFLALVAVLRAELGGELPTLPTKH